ncbi:YfcC family protein [Virgibacillus saliphilus]|uniref:YfcC family protein n=1 Tax=Virgibacillus saliphilus TaxID=2831674 RepID=UPI002106A864|nr:AbgT family transporter [Virgibacillus sp. NKC19-3]
MKETEERKNTKKRKAKFKMPDVYVLLFFLVVLASVATYVIPAGEYDRVEQNDITVVDPDSFHSVEQSPVGISNIFMSIAEAMIDSADIIFLILFLGGAFRLMEASGAINAGVLSLINKFENRRSLLIVLLGSMFALLLTTGFSANATVAFIPIGILIAKALKLDAIAGVAIVFLTSMTGFTIAFLNPKVLGIAQQVAELPLFSGIGYRIVLFVVFTVITILYILWYCKRIQDDPSKSYMGENKFPHDTSEVSIDTDIKFTVKHSIVLLLFIAGMAFYVYGALNLDFGMNEMTALFLVIAIGSGIITGLNANEIVAEFMNGMRGLVYAALIVGAARAVVFVLEDGKIVDTIINGFAQVLELFPSDIAAIGMLWANAIFNFFVNSGSGQAMVTMPIWTPLADILGITRQVTVQAFQFGDGITNLLWPTSGTLMAALAMGGVPYGAWFKFIWRLILIWMILASIAIYVAMLFNWGPF